MGAWQIAKSPALLKDYLKTFDDCFTRSESVGHLLTYVKGQLSGLRRKSIQPIAHASGVSPRTLQHFLSRHAWDEERVLDTLQQIVARDHQHPCSIALIGEATHPKKGDKTPGVQRQWCSTTGKIENCTSTVHLGYAAGDFHCLLDEDLFLPKRWADDRARCRSAGIPEQMTLRPKWQIALDLYRRAVANGVRFEWLTFEEHYVQVPQLLFNLDDRGQRYSAEVPPTFTGWLIKPALAQKRQYRGTPRRRKRPRLKIKSPPATTVQNLCRYSHPVRKHGWERFHVKAGTKGLIAWEGRAATFYLERDGLPTRPHWLIFAHSATRPAELRYFVSNAPEDTRPDALLNVPLTGKHVERCLQDEKSRLGLSDFEVRNYLSLRRHLILTAVSHLFLARARKMWPGETGP